MRRSLFGMTAVLLMLFAVPPAQAETSVARRTDVSYTSSGNLRHNCDNAAYRRNNPQECAAYMPSN